MKLISLKLRGAIGIKKGLGLDEISLDLSGLSGLVALEGPNGHGKTTVLENLTAYRSLASRKKALHHHFFLRDSFRELVFIFDGHTYKILIKIDPESEKQEGFVWKDGESQVNGKVTEYDRYIENLLGSERLYFASIFSGQNSEKISDMRTGELKALFSEFLRLDRYIDWESTAKQCINILDFRLSESGKKVDKLNADISGCGDLEARIETDSHNRRVLSEELALAQTNLGASEKSLESNKMIVQKNELCRDKVKLLTAEKARIEKDLSEDKKSRDKELQGLRARVQTVGVEIQKYDNIITGKDKIRQAVSDTEKAQAEKERVNKTIETLTAQVSDLTDNINKKDKIDTELLGKIKEAQGDSKAHLLRNEIKTAQVQVVTLNKKGASCPGDPTCEFIAQALKAQERLPLAQSELEEREKELAEAIKKYGDQRASLDLERIEISDKRANLQKEIAALRDILKALDKTISDNRELVAQADQITKAEAQLEGLKTRKKELIEEGTRLKESWEEKIKNKEARLNEYADEIGKVEKDIKPEVDEAVKKDEEAIKRIKDLIAQKDKSLKEFDLKIAQLETKLKERDTAKAELETIKRNRETLTRELQEWIYIKNACGKDGLRALEIDSVAPVITGYSNDLLNQTFGPLFSVRFRTQSDDGKEVLDILVIREDGTEVLLDNLSGGEEVWILKSLRLAMALISKEKSGRNYETLLCDEEDGALSKDNATKFIMLYRSLMKMAGMGTCLYISHRPEALALADYRLVFGDTGIEVE